MNKFKKVVEILKNNNNKKVFFHYDLCCVAEIERLTTKGLSCTDALEKRFFMTEEQFNRYNEGCDFEDIIKIREIEE